LQPTIKLVDIHKAYKTATGEYWALRGVNLEVWKGEIIAIMGPSGSGKTTLLNMIGLLDKPTKGEVYIEGKRTSQLTELEMAQLRNKTIGFIFQQFNLINKANSRRKHNPTTNTKRNTHPRKKENSHRSTTQSRRKN